MNSRKQIISLTIAAVVSVGAIWVHAISAQQYPLDELAAPGQELTTKTILTPKTLNRYQSTPFQAPSEFNPSNAKIVPNTSDKYAIAPAGDPNSETWKSEIVDDSSDSSTNSIDIQRPVVSDSTDNDLELPSVLAKPLVTEETTDLKSETAAGGDFRVPDSFNSTSSVPDLNPLAIEEPSTSIEFDSGHQPSQTNESAEAGISYGTTEAAPIVVRNSDPDSTSEFDDIEKLDSEPENAQFPSTGSAPFKPASFSVVEPSVERPFAARSQADIGIPQNTRPSGGNESVSMSDDLSLSPPPQPGIPTQSFLPIQPPAFPAVQQGPNFNPQAGHRRPWPIQRAKTYPLDDGEKFDFETKKRDYPPFNEIIATGRFFYSAEVLWAEPQFQGNTAIATEAVNFGQSISSDFDSDFHPRVRFGFESQYGPGIEFTYFNINSNSEIASFTSDGNVVGHTNAWVIGRNVWSRIFADDPGELLASQHSIDIDSATVSFFKELKFPISRVNGNFGFQYVSIAQQLNANVTSAGGATVETLQSTTDMRAFGPRAIIEYYRPIGHTPLELITSFGGSVLFGQRDQFVSNSQTGLENRLGADEFLTILDFLAAVQYKKTIGENRSWFARFGFMNQTWIGGGTAAFPQGDFGLRGLTFGIGYNR